MNKHLPISNDIKRIIGKYTLPLKYKYNIVDLLFKLNMVREYLDYNIIRYKYGGILYKCPNFNMAKYKFEKELNCWVLRPKSDTILELYF
jgi:hypothetical protein